MKEAADQEAFEGFETKIDEVVSILQQMNSCDKVEQKNAIHRADRYLGSDTDYTAKLCKDDFIVRIKDDRTVINRPNKEDQTVGSSSMGKMAFMAEMERDAAKRAKERCEREAVAQNLRKLGNQSFGKAEYEKAINLYTKAIDQIKDSAILYNNRALTYIRLGLHKRAIMDADFVLQKLDEKNLRAWLYRGNGYFMLDEISDFEKSIIEAKKGNPKELRYIEQVVDAIKGAVPSSGGDTNTNAELMRVEE